MKKITAHKSADFMPELKLRPPYTYSPSRSDLLCLLFQIRPAGCAFPAPVKLTAVTRPRAQLKLFPAGCYGCVWLIMNVDI